MGACASIRPALVLLLLATPVSAGEAPSAERVASSPSGRWFVAVRPDATFDLGESRPVAGGGRERRVAATGLLPQVPEEIAILDSGGGFVALDSWDRRGAGFAVVLVDGQGRVWARHRLASLFDAATVGAFWAPDDRTRAWRVDEWVDEAAGCVVVIPDPPAEPVAVSLRDGLVETPDPAVFVRRMADRSAWFGSRLRALEQAALAAPEPEGLLPVLRDLAREPDAPLLLRLRAAAVLDQHGDPTGRALVLLTARPKPEPDGLPSLPPEDLRRPPEVDRPCDRLPPLAADRPFDDGAGRSYAIQLLPAFLGREAAPLLGALLAGEREQDRFDALQAIACMAASEGEATETLLVEIQQRHEREARRLGAVSRIVPLGSSAVPAFLLDEALSLDAGRSSDAVGALLLRSPASNPVLAGLLGDGGPDDIRIARHFALHPDPAMIGALLQAIERYRLVPETAAEMAVALEACLPDAERPAAPSALDDAEYWLDWGAGWRTRQRARLLGQLMLGLLPLAVLVGMTRARERRSWD